MAGTERVQVELYEKKMMRVEETGPDPTASTVRPVHITEACDETSKRVVTLTDPSTSAPQRQISTADWLVSITNDSNSKVEAIRSRIKPRIQRVPNLLRKNQKSAQLFEPEVVAIGPYHAAKPHLKPMNEHKKAAAKRFVADTSHSIDLFYNKVRDVAQKAKECYATAPELSDKEFVDVMFFDGCFLLQFIDLLVKNKTNELTMSTHLQGFIMKDMFLLENQLPLIVLNALMSLKSVNLAEFIDKIIGGSTSSSKTKKLTPQQPHGRGIEPEVEEPCHLLDLLRKRLLGPVEAGPCPSGGEWNTFRSAMELKEVGIRFKKSETSQLRDIRFKNGFVHGWLSLPPIVIDDLTTSRFLNLIALEMCPDSLSDYGITSYVWFMDRLIDHPEDVKVLRSKGILLNALGSDQQVADLFNELATDFSPDHQAYFKVIQGIDNHYNNKTRVSIVRMVHTHFGSPWTTIAFMAAVFLLILTVIQTVYTVWPSNK